MPSPRRLLAPSFPLLLAAAPLLAQTPPQPSGAQPSGAQPTEVSATAQAPKKEPIGQEARRGKPIALEVGHIHPVSGPTIEDGVLLIRDERIVALGRKGEIEIPDDATVRSFPDGHAYPGLIDAKTDAFLDPATAGADLDPSLAVEDDLRLRHTRDDLLVESGITTAYIGGRGGQGAIVRATHEGFRLWKDKGRAGVHLRLTSGPVNSHALQRQAKLDGALKTFDELDKYEKAKEDHRKALEKYAKDFQRWLDYHAKKKKKGKTGEAKPKKAQPVKPSTPAGRHPPAPNGPSPSGGQAVDEAATAADAERAGVDHALDLLFHALAADAPSAQEPVKGTKPPTGQSPEKGKGPKKQQPAKEKPPQRPKYPRKPREDPVKETLLRVLDGELPLRVEAHRPDELRAALRFLSEKDVPMLVLEGAYGADALADRIAQTGAFVVLTDVLTPVLPKVYESFDLPGLAAKLDAAGVPFAIAGGHARRSAMLPMLASSAVGGGLPPETALRAITLTPAEILGIQKDTGSLQRGKYADIAVFDRPLFASDSRVLLVIERGRTEYEAR